MATAVDQGLTNMNLIQLRNELAQHQSILDDLLRNRNDDYDDVELSAVKDKRDRLLNQIRVLKEQL